MGEDPSSLQHSHWQEPQFPNVVYTLGTALRSPNILGNTTTLETPF